MLYLLLHYPEQADSGYFDELAAGIAALLDAYWDHALVLFTSYAAQQFKDGPGSVLLATGAAWEGFDFPGDCVSLLVIPLLPFSHPNVLKEKKRAEYPSLQAFIRAVVVPKMQIKLKQGFGRATAPSPPPLILMLTCNGDRTDPRGFIALHRLNGQGQGLALDLRAAAAVLAPRADRS